MKNIFSFSTEKKAEGEKKLETEVRLNIFRHSKKENDPNRPNSELLLTLEGRELAHEKGMRLNPDSRVAVAGASPMDRAAETAMLVMMANEDNIGAGDSLEDMNKKIVEEMRVGKKIYRDERLGFSLDGPIHEEGMSAFKAGKYMEWLVNDSDRQAIEKGDKISTTYLRQAGNISELVKRHQQVGNNFNHLVARKRADNIEFSDHLERYLASHQAVVESFVAEVIKNQGGEAARAEFISNLKNGWAETEGISISIINKGEKQTIKMIYPDKDGPKEMEIKPETIDKIINERNEFEELIKQA